MVDRDYRKIIKTGDMIVNERFRQVNELGWDFKHEDEYNKGEMAYAAASYLLASHDTDEPNQLWPWDASYFHKEGYESNLIRAGALIMAELQRLDRLNHLVGLSFEN